jgi:hypothetical protein
MSITFSPLNYKIVIIYFDDTIIHSKDIEAHLLYLREIFEIIGNIISLSDQKNVYSFKMRLNY